MGVLAPGSAQAPPCAQPPIDTSGNFSAHMSVEGEGQKEFLAISGDSKHFSFFPKNPPKKWVPQYFVSPQ